MLLHPLDHTGQFWHVLADTVECGVDNDVNATAALMKAMKILVRLLQFLVLDQMTVQLVQSNLKVY